MRVEESMAQKGVDWKVGSRSEAVSPGASEEGGLLTFGNGSGPFRNETRERRDRLVVGREKAQPFDTRWERKEKAKPTSGEASTGARERRQHRANGGERNRGRVGSTADRCAGRSGSGDVFYEMAFRKVARMAFSLGAARWLCGRLTTRARWRADFRLSTSTRSGEASGLTPRPWVVELLRCNIPSVLKLAFVRVGGLAASKRWRVGRKAMRQTRRRTAASVCRWGTPIA